MCTSAQSVTGRVFVPVVWPTDDQGFARSLNTFENGRSAAPGNVSKPHREVLPAVAGRSASPKRPRDTFDENR